MFHIADSVAVASRIHTHTHIEMASYGNKVKRYEPVFQHVLVLYSEGILRWPHRDQFVEFFYIICSYAMAAQRYCICIYQRTHTTKPSTFSSFPKMAKQCDLFGRTGNVCLLASARSKALYLYIHSA